MNLVSNIKKIEKSYVKGLTGKMSKTSRMTICLTALGISLLSSTAASKIGQVKDIEQSTFLGDCCLESVPNIYTIEDAYISNCKNALNNIDSESKSYISDDVLIDVISKKVKDDKNVIIKNNIIGDDKEYETLEEQIILLANDISLNSKEYENIYPNLYTDNIEECLGSYRLTSYCPCASCCGSSTGLTASGTVAKANHTIAADKSIPFGTKLLIEGTVYTVEDHGGAVNGKHIDVFYNTHSEALHSGTRYAKVYLIKDEGKKLTYK